MNEGIHLDLDTWIVPGQIRKANLCRGLGNRYTTAHNEEKFPSPHPQPCTNEQSDFNWKCNLNTTGPPGHPHLGALFNQTQMINGNMECILCVLVYQAQHGVACVTPGLISVSGGSGGGCTRG